MRLFLLLYCAVILLLSCTQKETPKTGYSRIFDTHCAPRIEVEVGGQSFVVLPDTGSGNFSIASKKCGNDLNKPNNCYGATLYTGPISGTKSWSMIYGAGNGVMFEKASNLLEWGGLSAPVEFGAVTKNLGTEKDGFFFHKEGKDCFASWSGILGLVEHIDKGTYKPAFNYLVDRGVPDAFAMQFCEQGVGVLEKFTSSHMSGKDVKPNTDLLGHLFLGGFSSQNIAGDMKYTKYSGEYSYKVRIDSMHLNGKKIQFREISGGLKKNSLPIIDSGTTRLVLNSKENSEAVVNAFIDSDFIKFGDPKPNHDEKKQFFQGLKPIKGATINSEASFTVFFKDEDEQGVPFPVSVNPGSIFQIGPEGLWQNGIALAPGHFTSGGVILGDTFLGGNMVFFDRKNKRIGFAPGANCNSVMTAADINVYPE